MRFFSLPTQIGYSVFDKIIVAFFYRPPSRMNVPGINIFKFLALYCPFLPWFMVFPTYEKPWHFPATRRACDRCTKDIESMHKRY